MPATVDDLAEALRQYFAGRFQLGGDGGPGSVLLVFEALGFPISLTEFTGRGNPHIGDLLAHQRAAQLADQIPAANALLAGTYLPRGGSKLSRWYTSIVRGSEGPAATEGAALVAFEAAKLEADQLIAHNELTVVSAVDGSPLPAGTYDSYYATSMTPVDWFRPESTAWQSYSIDAEDNPPHSAPSWHFRIPPYVYREIPVPPPGEPITVPAIIDYVRVATEAERYAETVDPTGLPDAGHWDGTAVDEWRIRSLFDNPDFQAAQQPEIGLQLTPISGAPGQPAVRLLSAVTKDGYAAAHHHHISQHFIAANDKAAKSPLFGWDPSQMATDVSAAASIIASTTSAAPSSTDFSVRFEYCLVRFDRPWWDDVFLTRRDWKLPGYEAGKLSAGSATQPTDPITLMTLGMVVVRNLHISARWSPADLQAITRSTSLGPFCLAAAAFDTASGTLTRKGPQAVAWLCQVPPRLPPDPA